MSKTKYTIIITSFGDVTHFTPILRIAQSLITTNHKIVLVTSQCTLNKIKQKSFKIQSFGIEDGIEKFLKDKSDTFPIGDISSKWDGPFNQIMDAHKPDLIISDFMTLPSLKYALTKKVKLIINVPGSIQLLQNLNFINFEKSISIAGFTFFYPQIVPQIIQSMLPFRRFIGNAMESSIVLFNSFFGIDKTTSLPPNCILTGGLLSKSNQEIEQDLNQWLKCVRKQKLDVILVTFGSHIQLTQKFIQKLFQALKFIKKAVIWKFKQNHRFPQYDNKYFFVKNQINQSAIVKLPEIKLIITHCEWNSTIQYINFLKPILCCPIFQDNHTNAELIQKLNIGIRLVGRKNYSWKIPEFQSKVNQLINNQKYSKQLIKLKNLSVEAGGYEKIHKVIQNYLINGNQHLIDKSHNKIRKTGIRDTIKILILIVVCWTLMMYIQ